MNKSEFVCFSDSNIYVWVSGKWKTLRGTGVERYNEQSEHKCISLVFLKKSTKRNGHLNYLSSLLWHISKWKDFLNKKKNIRRDLILSVGNWFDCCRLLIAVISCDWQVAGGERVFPILMMLMSLLGEGNSCFDKKLGLLGHMSYKQIMMCTFKINTSILHLNNKVHFWHW